MGPTPEATPPPPTSTLPAWMRNLSLPQRTTSYPPKPSVVAGDNKDVTVAEVVSTRPQPELALTTSPAPVVNRNSGTALAPGFRFHPTDEELVSYYLKRKVIGKPVRFNAIAVVDIYKNEPWELAEKSRLKSRDQEWYFFSALDKKYTNGARMNRATGKGYWKATGKDREIKRNLQLIAMKKTLVFHSGRAPGGQRTNWVMHEYRLHEEEYDRIRSADPGQLEIFVLCRVFHKNNIGPPNGNRYAPFLEEEWDDGQAAVVPGEGAADEVIVPHDTCGETNQVDQDSQSINKDSAADNDAQIVLPACKAEPIDDFHPMCVLNTEAPFPLLQYKRRKSNKEIGSNGSNSSENSTWINQDPSSSSTTTVTTDLMMTTNSATTTAVSALLEFSLVAPIERKQSTYASPPASDATKLDLSVPPSCVKFINDMQGEMQNISAERDTLRLELMNVQTMISILRSRVDCVRKENDDLKRHIWRSE